MSYGTNAHDPMNADGTHEAADPVDRRDKRALTISIVVGTLVGFAHGVPRYGVFDMRTVAFAGLGMILVVAVHAGVIALLPARNPPPPDAV